MDRIDMSASRSTFWLFRVCRNIPRELCSSAGTALVGLRGVLHLEFPEIQTDIFHYSFIAIVPAGVHTSYEYIFQCNFQIFQRILATGLADRKGAFVDVLARRASLKKIRRCLVDVMGEAQVLNAHLARAAAGSRMEAATLGQTPAPAQNVNLLLMLCIGRLTLNRVQL